MKRAILAFIAIACGVAACEAPATIELLEHARDERKEWLADFRTLDDAAALARYDVDLKRLAELGVVPSQVPGSDRFTLGAETHRGLKWALVASGKTRAELDQLLRELGPAKDRYTVHLLQIENDGWRLQLVDSVQPEIKFPDLREPGVTWKSSRRKQLEAEIAALDVQLGAERHRLGRMVRPAYVALTRKNVEVAALGPSSLSNVAKQIDTMREHPVKVTQSPTSPGDVVVTVGQ